MDSNPSPPVRSTSSQQMDSNPSPPESQFYSGPEYSDGNLSDDDSHLVTDRGQPNMALLREPDGNFCFTYVIKRLTRGGGFRYWDSIKNGGTVQGHRTAVG